MPLYLVVGRTNTDSVFFDHVSASDAQAAEAAVLAELATGLSVDKNGNRSIVQYAIILMDAAGTITPNIDPANATLTGNINTANQATIISNATTALTNNATFLGLGSPTNAQVLAQVQALTRQVDGLIRFAIQNFSGTT